MLGDMSLTISNFVAYPDQANLKRIENGQQFEASRFAIFEPLLFSSLFFFSHFFFFFFFFADSMSRIDPGTSFGQSVLTICPNVNPAYERGTYSVALFGLLFLQLVVRR